MRRLIVGAALVLLLPSSAFGQANGKLQLHFMHVGQGDGAILISPKGETVLFDNGHGSACDLPISYLQQLGVRQIDYHIASHYHYDHIGCTDAVLSEFPLRKTAYDRGGSYGRDHYDDYVAAVGSRRKKATSSTVITLDAGEPHPVKVKIVALNGNGVDTDDENDKSVVAVIQCGEFSAEIGGDLSGFDTPRYKDIESSVAPKVGKVDLYKVHHHGSDHSTNETWLQAIEPTVAIISAGEKNNTYGHPTPGCLERLHGMGIRTFWTSRGKGADPNPSFDRVCGNVIVETIPGSSTFTVTCTKDWHTVVFSAVPGEEIADTPATAAATGFAWSVRSEVYHFAECSYVENISPGNLATGTSPPAGKRLHQGCPK